MELRLVYAGICLLTPGVANLHPIILPTTGPMFFLGGGTLVTGSRSFWGWGYPSPVLSGTGVPPSQDRTGVPPGQDWSITPPPTGYIWTGYAAGCMLLAVSGRSTVLCHYQFQIQ